MGLDEAEEAGEAGGGWRRLVEDGRGWKRMEEDGRGRRRREEARGGLRRLEGEANWSRPQRAPLRHQQTIGRQCACARSQLDKRGR